MRLSLFATLFVVWLCVSGCISEREVGSAGSFEREATSGVIVSSGLEATWSAAKSVLAQMSTRPIVAREDSKIVEASYAGADLRVRIQAYDSKKSIVRVKAERGGVAVPELADEILVRLSQALR